ncbi:hypothetical protein M9H77_34019 [Catharanthus roseus]|uniref:Uncharacterized protein n=1 Tax=Catharanthus roseus TaxID=4058 RepID=A0ACB9ZLQ6_CATRO|nr:hypothetical protein M9H77_34019 [Catharanthus roseus]
MTSSNVPAAKEIIGEVEKKSRESKQNELQEGNRSSSMLPFDDDVSPLSKPYIHFILTKSHINPVYVIILPSRLYPNLPSAMGPTLMVPTTILCREKSWETTLYVNSKMKKLEKRWKVIVDDNGLKSSNEKVKFKVQIIKGDFPTKLTAKIDGNTRNTPICIE